MALSRRTFLAAAASAAAVQLVTRPRNQGQDPEPAPMPTRKLTRRGIEVPILGFGSALLGKLPDDQEDACVAVIRRAYDLGVRYFDTAPSYDDHRSERRLQKALVGLRDQVWLSTKSFLVPKADALEELESSLKVLGTDHVDVFQVHAVADDEDRKQKLDAEKGTLAAALQAQKDGKCRFVGVTGHAMPEVMARCLDDFDFDTMLVPVNCADPLWRSFAQEVLPKAKQKGTTVVAMKVMAAGKLIEGGKVTAAECVRWTLSQDVAVAIPGCTSRSQVEADVAAVRPFVPMTKAELEALTARLGPHPGNALEWYKKEPPKPGK